MKASSSQESSVDVLVVGGGLAGATTATVAAEAGLTVMLVEKQDALGGTCVYSAGNLLQLTGPDALEHLVSLCFGRTPTNVLNSYLLGLQDLRGWLESRGAKTSDVSPAMLPNCWPNSPGADGVTYYAVDGDGNGAGAALFGVVSASLAASDVDVRTGTSFSRLLTDSGRVIGAEIVNADGSTATVTARRGVALTTGGFENDPALCEAYLPVAPVLPVGNPGNTGDGLRAAQSVGAALWHMSTFYGFWAFQDPQAGNHGTAFPLLLLAPGHIIVGPDGRRFAAETGREAHDVLRSVGDFLPDRSNRPGLPAYAIFDRALLEAGPLARFPSATGYEWSSDNAAEIAQGWISTASSVAGLADAIGVDRLQLVATIESYNHAATVGDDREFARPASSMRPIDTDHLFAIRIWPGVATTSGGPRRDGRGRVLRDDGQPIPGLYAAGGNGGVWGHLTEHGGGLTDALVFGAIVARDLAGTSGELRPE